MSYYNMSRSYVVNSWAVFFCSKELILKRSMFFFLNNLHHSRTNLHFRPTQYREEVTWSQWRRPVFKIYKIIKDEVLLTVSCPIFPSILIVKNLLTGSLKNRSIDNLETQKKSISMKNSQSFDYLLYAKSK